MSAGTEDRFDLSPLGESGLFSAELVGNTVPAGGEIVEGLRGLPPPERWGLQAGVDHGRHLEAIAGIRVAVIVHPFGQVLPQGQPRRACQAQRGSESCRVSVREVQADENTLPVRHTTTQGIPDDDLGLAPR